MHSPGRQLNPHGSKLYPFRVDPFSERDCYANEQTQSHKHRLPLKRFGKSLSSSFNYLDPVVQSFVSLTCNVSLTNSLTALAEVFSNTLIFLLQKCGQVLQSKIYSHLFLKKLSMYLPYFKIEILMSR